MELSSICTQDLWSSVRVIIGFLVKSQTLFSRLLILVGSPALGRILVVKLLPSRLEATGLLGIFSV